MGLSGIDRSEMVQSIPRGVDKSMQSSGPSFVSAFSQCYLVHIRCLLTLCVERAYMRALVDMLHSTDWLSLSSQLNLKRSGHLRDSFIMAVEQA